MARTEIVRSLEIISVRTSGNLEQKIRTALGAICREVKVLSAVKAEVYANGDFPSDLAIILSWEGVSPKGEKTDLGYTLSATLRRFGLVDHVVWVMTKEGPDIG